MWILLTAAFATTVDLGYADVRRDGVGTRPHAVVHGPNGDLLVGDGQLYGPALAEPRDLGWATALCVADLEGDGQEELVVRVSGTVQVQDALTGAVRMEVPFPYSVSGVDVGCGDLDGDRVPEVFHFEAGSFHVMGFDGVVRFTIGGGALSSWATPTSTSGHRALAWDHDGDGLADLLVAGRRYDGRTGQPLEIVRTGGHHDPGQVLVDADGDGLDEVLTHHNGVLALWEPDLGGHRWQASSDVFATWIGAAMWDVDGDGGDDLVTWRSGRAPEWRDPATGLVLGTLPSSPGSPCCFVERLTVAPGVERGVMGFNVYDGGELRPTLSGEPSLRVADLDGDGRDEVIVLSETLLIFDPDGTPLPAGLGTGFTDRIQIIDADGDGDDDLVTFGHGVRRLDWSRRRGLSVGEVLFDTATDLPYGRLADLDGDGALDVVYANGTIDGATGVPGPLTAMPWPVEPMDVDQDGRVDLFLSVSVGRMRLYDTSGTQTLVRYSADPIWDGETMQLGMLGWQERYEVTPAGRMHRLDQRAVAGVGLGVFDGRVWSSQYGSSAYEITSEDLVTGDRWILQSPHQAEQLVVVEGHVWVTHTGGFQVWALP
jgi:hypothetical protein